METFFREHTKINKKKIVFDFEPITLFPKIQNNVIGEKELVEYESVVELLQKSDQITQSLIVEHSDSMDKILTLKKLIDPKSFEQYCSIYLNRYGIVWKDDPVWTWKLHVWNGISKKISVAELIVFSHSQAKHRWLKIAEYLGYFMFLSISLAMMIGFCWASFNIYGYVDFAIGCFLKFLMSVSPTFILKSLGYIHDNWWKFFFGSIILRLFRFTHVSRVLNGILNANLYLFDLKLRFFWTVVAKLGKLLMFSHKICFELVKRVALFSMEQEIKTSLKNL